MKPLRKDPAEQCTLHFSKDFPNMDDLRTEISRCLSTGKDLWLSYDEDAGIERLTQTENGFEDHKHYELSDFFDIKEDSEADMEALAYQEPYLWFCGSMSLKRNSPDKEDDIERQIDALAEVTTDANRFSLGCIPCIEKDGHFELVKETEYNGKTIKPLMLRGGTKSTELHNALQGDEHLERFMQIPCKDNGFDIEGLAIHEDRIFIGLRGPVLNGFAVIIEICCKDFEGELLLCQQEGEDKFYRKHFVDLHGMGIRELNIDKKGDLYLLAGPTMDLDGTISICRIKGGLKDVPFSVVHEPEVLFDVARGSEIEHGSDKAEGMAFLENGHVLITYDSPVKERLIEDHSVKMDCYDID